MDNGIISSGLRIAFIAALFALMLIMVFASLPSA